MKSSTGKFTQHFWLVWDRPFFVWLTRSVYPHYGTIEIYLFVHESLAPVTWSSKPHMYALRTYFWLCNHFWLIACKNLFATYCSKADFVRQFILSAFLAIWELAVQQKKKSYIILYSMVQQDGNSIIMLCCQFNEINVVRKRDKNDTLKSLWGHLVKHLACLTNLVSGKHYAGRKCLIV